MRQGALLAALILLAAQPAWAGPKTGPDQDPYGINIHLAPDTVIDKLAQAGVTWVRCDFNWKILEPNAKGQFDWTEPDRIVARTQANGQRIFATLAYTPGWANGGQDGSVPAANPRDFYDFVYAVVSRYKGKIDHWGMWNEPNLDLFWKGTRDQYIQDVLRNGADAAKAADPGCFVLGPELAMLESGKWEDWLTDVLSKAGDRIDVVTQHIYMDDANGVLTALDGKRTGKPAAKFLVDRYGRGQEVWITETGWAQPGDSEAKEASEYGSLLTGMLARGYFTKVFFYEAIDDPNIKDHWGILHSDLSEKPAYTVYSDFAAAHKGAKDWLAFDAANDFQHQTGRASPAGWTASAGQDAAGYLLFGPYTKDVPPSSKRVAVWRLTLDSLSPSDEVVATLDVNDATAQKVLATRDVKRGEFHAANQAQGFWLNFDAPSSGDLEFRVAWKGKGTLSCGEVAVRPGSDIQGASGCEVVACGAKASAANLWPLGALLLVVALRGRSRG